MIRVVASYILSIFSKDILIKTRVQLWSFRCLFRDRSTIIEVYLNFDIFIYQHWFRNSIFKSGKHNEKSEADILKTLQISMEKLKPYTTGGSTVFETFLSPFHETVQFRDLFHKGSRPKQTA